MKSFKLCLIVPCYNEEERLPKLKFEQFLADNPHIKLLLVNDGSRDKTLELIQDMAARHENADFLNLKVNYGKAEAVRRGTLKALEEEVDLVGYWDADLATPFSEVPYFLELFEDPKTQLVMGSRILRLGGDIDRKWYRHFLGRLFATVASMLLGIPVYDTQCGAKIFRSGIALEIFKEDFISYWLFDVELLFRMKRKWGSELMNQIVELPLHKWKDESGSKVTVFDFLKAPLEMIRIFLRYK